MRAARETIKLIEGHSFRVLRWATSLRNVESLVAPGVFSSTLGEGTHWHYHPEMELTLFTSGAGTRFVGDHIGAFEPGDLVLLGENLPHYWHTQGPSSGVSVQWDFSQNHPFWAFPETLSLAPLFKRAGYGLRLTGELAKRVASQISGLSNSSGASHLGALLQLLGTLLEGTPQESMPLSSRSFALSNEGPHQRAIADVVRHLVVNFREEVRLEDVLQLAGMSRPTFARQFKQHSGRTFSEFVNGLRMQAACLELAQTTRPILDIALGCGFTQISFFNRLFRRTQRCSPSEYRTRARART